MSDNQSVALEVPNTTMIKVVSSAGRWAMTRQILVRGFGVLQMLFIARYLAPEQLGVFSVAQIVYGFVEAITFFGLSQSLIQKKNVTDTELNTVYVTNIVRGLILFFVIAAIAYPISIFMNSPQSFALVIAVGLMPLLIGLQNPGMIFFQKNLEYNKDFTFYIFSSFANFIVSVAAILNGFASWSLVFGLLAQALVQIIMSYRLSSFRPKWEFSLVTFKELFGFGQWLLVSQALKYFSNNLPVWVIGSFSGVYLLGVYNMASRFSQSVGSELAALISNVAYPTFSKFLDDRKRLRSVYLRSQKVASVTSFLVFGSIISFVDPFIKLFLGLNWFETKTSIILLCLIGFMQSIGAQAEILKAINLPYIIAKFSAFRLLITAMIIIPLFKRYGVSGAVVAILIPTIVLLLPVMRVILNELQISKSDFTRIFLPGLFTALIFCWLNIYFFNPFVTNIPIFILGAALHVVANLGLFVLLDKAMGTKILAEVKSIIKAA